MALLARQRVFPARRFELRVFAFRPRKQLRHQGFLPLPPLILNRCVSDLPPPDSLNQPWVKVLAHRKWRAHGKRKAVKLLSAVIQSGCVLTVSVSCKGEGVTNLTFSASGLAE